MKMKLHIFPVMIFIIVVIFGLKSYDFAVGLDANGQADNNIAAKLNDIETAAGGGQEETGQTEPNASENNIEQDTGFVQSGLPYTGQEIELLQKLAERREELDKREREMEVREKLLVAAENGIDKKIASLKSIEEQIQALIAVHDEQEKAQIESLVKTYSAMKPKDAAKIFNTLDMDILITIIEKMNPKKVAEVLSKMQTNSANEITVELATRKKLPNIEG